MSLDAQRILGRSSPWKNFTLRVIMLIATHVTFQDPGKKYLWASPLRWNYTIGTSSLTLGSNILLWAVIAFKLCCSNDTAHVLLVWILFPPSKNLKKMQTYFILNIGPCVCLITSTSPPSHQTQKNLLSLWLVYGVEVFSLAICLVLSLWGMLMPLGQSSGGGCLKLGAKL